MPDYRIFLLGAPYLEHREQPVSMDTRKALALLAYLLLSGEPQSRDTLAALLWPDNSQSSARAALRRTLSTLRGALGEETITFGREIISLQPGGDIWCDVIAFRKHIAECGEHGHPEDHVCARCLNPLREAASLYKDTFMSGFSLRDSAEFDSWQFYQADLLRRELAGVLERLVTIYRERREFPIAVEYARRWLALDTLNEDAHRTLIFLYAQSGQRNAALRQYRECVRILEKELGVPPLEETTEVYEAVKSNRLEKFMDTKDGLVDSQLKAGDIDQISNASISLLPLDDRLPLVGRESELNELLRLYDGIQQDGAFAALTGISGIGKTHLAQQFIAHLQVKGAVTLSTSCYAGEANLAYTPLIDLLRHGLYQSSGRSWWEGIPSHWLTEAARLFPDIYHYAPTITHQASQEQPGAKNHFFEGLCQVFEALVQGEVPGVIFLDNLDMADQSTLDWLVYLGHRLKSRPIFLLVTWEMENQPQIILLKQLLTTQQEDDILYQVLSPLSPEASTALIGSYVQGGNLLSQENQKWLVRESGGLPYYLVAYLDAFQQGRFLENETQRWQIPENLRAVFKTRLDKLSEAAVQIIQAAVIIGRVFDLDVLKMVSGRNEDEIILGVEELVKYGLIDEADTQVALGQYYFKHEQLHAMVLGEISLVRRRLLHRRTAEALQSLAQRISAPDLSAQLAYHYHQAGVPEEAAEHYYRAGQTARMIYANAEALVYFQSALALGYANKTGVQTQIGDLYALMGDYPQAIQQLEIAAAFSKPSDLPFIDHKIGLIYLRRGHWEQAGCHFEACIENLSALPADQQKAFEARVRSDWSLACHRSGQDDLAASLIQQAQVLAEKADDPWASAQVYNLLGILARAGKKHSLAMEHIEASLSIARKFKNTAAQIAALNNLALVQADLGQYTQASDTIRGALDDCIRLGDRHLEAALRNNFADLLRANGENEAAMEQLKKAVAIFAEIGQKVEDWEPEIWKLATW